MANIILMQGTQSWEASVKRLNANFNALNTELSDINLTTGQQLKIANTNTQKLIKRVTDQERERYNAIIKQMEAANKEIGIRIQGVMDTFNENLEKLGYDTTTQTVSIEGGEIQKQIKQNIADTITTLTGKTVGEDGTVQEILAEYRRGITENSTKLAATEKTLNDTVRSETWFQQTANSFNLVAKGEMDSELQNLKTQTEAAIEVKSNQIKSTVSGTINSALANSGFVTSSDVIQTVNGFDWIVKTDNEKYTSMSLKSGGLVISKNGASIGIGCKEGTIGITSDGMWGFSRCISTKTDAKGHSQKTFTIKANTYTAKVNLYWTDLNWGSISSDVQATLRPYAFIKLNTNSTDQVRLMGWNINPSAQQDNSKPIATIWLSRRTKRDSDYTYRLGAQVLFLKTDMSTYTEVSTEDTDLTEVDTSTDSGSSSAVNITSENISSYLPIVGSQTISVTENDGNISNYFKIGDILICCVQVSLTTSANSVGSASFNWPYSFKYAPYAVCSPVTTVPNTTFKGCGLKNVTTYGGDVYGYRTNTTTTHIQVIGVGIAAW